MVLTNTGQLVASVLVRVPNDTHQPVMMIQVPVGLFLPAGLNLQIDEGKPQPVPLQTCDLKGCYAGMQMSPELIASLKAGKRLTMTFQNLAEEQRGGAARTRELRRRVPEDPIGAAHLARPPSAHLV